ncbi:MgtC/SapB family protein [Sphingomonas quercus]|uniref:MgtC/SapB family protein n=1 Tax=Sphingomonas quercus TaxID=2842451 RepID=UPI00209A96C5|nr:MgtC/SapB family protein [Sphingomonas quercus]
MPELGTSWESIALRLGLATLVGLVLGLEREWRGRDAGLRTHALVALSSAAITVSALLITESQPAGRSDPLRAVQGLAQAIGFIAGGLIFVRGGDVRNMTTAASLWLAAAVGIAAGAGQLRLVLLAAGMALAVLSLVGLAERLFPARRRAGDQAGELGLPNRRGAIDRGAGEDRR